MTERFEGFPEEAIPFMLELQATQDRGWFKANQDTFDRTWKEPFEALFSELVASLADTFPEITAQKPHIFRIYRDTRFSKDKSPYKTHLAASVPLRSGGTEERPAPGLYLAVGIDHSFVGGGQWHMTPEMIQRFRERLDDEKAGARAQKLVDDVVAKGFGIHSMDALKRVPAPYPQDHPRAELLKRKGLGVGADIPEELIESRELLDWCAERVRQSAPLLRWMDEELTG
jgi:uncharacterized protein (TIGR02453 family)